MKVIAKFEKVSFKQFKKDFLELNKNSSKTQEEIKSIYDNIKLPTRATKTSAGYDFFLPYEIEMNPNDTLSIPTGIRAKIQDDYALFIMPKSGLGSKYRLILNNTAGLIDSDYYYSDNEGHILAKLFYDIPNSKNILSLPSGKSFVQGFFFQFGVAEGDNVTTTRNGGFGSTH